MLKSKIRLLFFFFSDRSHVNVNNSNTNITSNFSPSTAAAATNQANSKLNVKSIVSVEPLKIKLAEEEEPRAPNQGETDTLVKKLFDVYKLQKQQVSLPIIYQNCFRYFITNLKK